MQPLYGAGRTELAECWAVWSVQHEIADICMHLVMPLHLGLLVQ